MTTRNSLANSDTTLENKNEVFLLGAAAPTAMYGPAFSATNSAKCGQQTKLSISYLRVNRPDHFNNTSKRVT